ncbi:MAG: ferritin family protein [Candidatus Bathyarchaeota archaeon]|nr:MAG: ferritin family protein [Candidatus Bathyarchaeota archaeon]
MERPSILEAALKIEEQSIALYTKAREKTENPSAKKFLAELANEELKHKEKILEAMKDEAKISQIGSRMEQVQDLRIVDFMTDTSLSADADYERILIYAAKREKATYEYYKSLASGLEGTEVGVLFKRLALEELKHKNRLETEYDDYLLNVN